MAGVGGERTGRPLQAVRIRETRSNQFRTGTTRRFITKSSKNVVSQFIIHSSESKKDTRDVSFLWRSRTPTTPVVGVPLIIAPQRVLHSPRRRSLDRTRYIQPARLWFRSRRCLAC